MMVSCIRQVTIGSMTPVETTIILVTVRETGVTSASLRKFKRSLRRHY